MDGRKFLITGVFTAFLTLPISVWAQDSVKETEQLDFAQGLLSRGMYDMAILQYQKFIADYPRSPSLQEAYLSLGEGYFLSQNFSKAIDTFNQFNQLYPNSDKLPVSVLRLGQIDIEQEKYDEAFKKLTSIDLNGLKGQILQSLDFYIAKAYLGKTDSTSALTFFQRASQVQGASDYSADAFKEMGKLYAQGAQYPQALDAYQKALALTADDTLKGELHYRIAEVQFLSGQYADAVKEFSLVLEKYPNLGFNQDALANMLLAYFNLDQYDQLLKGYQQYAPQIKNDDSCFTIHMAAVMAYIELQEYDQANKLLDRMLSFAGLKPWENAKIFIKKAAILIKNKNYKDALALLNAYSSENTDNADENFFLMAQCYFGLGDYDKAFSDFEYVTTNFANSRYFKASLLGQAHCRKQAGKLKEAESLFLKYYDMQDQPDLKSEALYDAVMMNVQAGDAKATISAAQEYLKAFPNGGQYSDVLLLLADSYSRNNQQQEAVKLLQGYLASVSPQRPNGAYFLLAYNQELLGNSDQALAAYGHVDQNKEGGKFYFSALKNMAIIYLAQKNFDQASNYFDRLISQSAQGDLQIKTYIWVCNEYLKRQKYDDVLRVASQAEKHFPSQDLMEIDYFKAESLRGLGRCEEADKYYDMMTASTAKNAFTGSAHIGKGLCLEQEQKLDEAKQELQKALDENADDYTITAHANFEMANIDAAQADFNGALRLYLLVATIYDDAYYCPESLWRAGQIFERLQRKADALKMYSEILDKYKDSDVAKDAQERINLLK